MNLYEFRKRIEGEGKIKACKLIKPSTETEDQANAIIGYYFHHALCARRWASAAMLIWGDGLFDVRPQAVQVIMQAIKGGPKHLFQGGGSVGKSYTVCGCYLLDWLSDPEHTTTKVVSASGQHAKSQAFATIKMLHEKAIIPLAGMRRAESIQFKLGDERGAITIVRVSEGEDNSEVLQGFHPLPRQQPHPAFGPTTRVRLIADEAEGIAAGLWTGIANMMAPIQAGDDSLKVSGAYNPKDPSSKVAELAEPPTGWSDFDIETGYRGKDQWMSKSGWHVVRIDPAKTENVLKRKRIFLGMQTYEGYMAYRNEGDGNSLNYYAFGRGAYPLQGAATSIFTPLIIRNIIGEFVFSSTTIKLGGFDNALDGRDDAILTVGRFGRAKAFRWHITNEDGKKSTQLIQFQRERKVLQIDQQFQIKKGDTQIVATDLRLQCRALGIDPQWLMMDSTGNGASVLGLLRADDFWSPFVNGLNFSKNATKKKVLEEDQFTAEEAYEGVASEIWFAAARLAEFRYLAISPAVGQDLSRQLLGRRQILGKDKLKKVEDKLVYKARMGRSPDHADSGLICVHMMRSSEELGASMIDLPDDQRKRNSPEKKRIIQVQDHVEFVSE